MVDGGPGHEGQAQAAGNAHLWWGPGHIALVYAIVGFAWIIASGVAVSLVSNESVQARLESAKGIAFVAVTSLLLWVLLRRHAQRLNETAGQLAQREADYQQVIQSVPVVVWTADAEGRIDFVNDRGLRYLGREHVTDGSQTWTSRVHPDEQEEVSRAQAEAVANGRDARVSFRLRGGNGEYRWFESRLAAVRDDAGHVVRFFGTLADVHDAMTARLALRRGQEQLEKITDTIPPGMMIASFQMWPDGRSAMPYASEGIADVYGVTADEVAEDASIIAKYTHADDRDAVTAAIIASGETMTPWRQQFRYHHPERGERWIEGHSMPVREDDGSLTWHGIITDVTDRRRIEDELLLTQSRLLAALEGGGVGTWIWEDGSRTIAVDAGVARLWGFPPGTTTVTSAELQAAIRPDDLLGAQEGLRAARESEQGSFAVTFRVRHGEAEERWVSLTGRHEGNGGGRLVGAAVDVTEFKLVQAALQASEDRFSKAFHMSPLAQVLMRESDRVIVEANDAYLRLLGFARDEVVGHPAGEITQGTDQGELGRIRERMRAHEPLTRMLFHFVRRDGAVGIALTSMEPVNLGGELHWLTIMNDITEQRAAEEALRQSEERFRELAESIREVFWLAEPHGRVLYVSPAFESVWGFGTAALYENPNLWRERIHDEDRARVTEAQRTELLGGYDEEYRVVRADGTVRWIRDRAFPVRDASGAVVRVAGVAEDITDRRELEEQVRQTQKMESVGELAGGVAHDFNNWLTVIQSYSDLLLEQLPEEGETREFVQEIQAAGERAASLTRQLLAFSRREIIERRVVEVNAIVLDTEKMLRRLLGEDVEVRTRLSQGLPRVHADPGQLVQVLMNLAVNARDAMPRGGTLLVETAAVTAPDAAPGERWIALRVSDTGTGMPPEVASRIFEPFFTTKGLGKGTGLGLSVVHGIVQQAGGRIELNTRPGEGTTFTVLLPGIEQQIGPGGEAPETSSQLVGTETILLAEDEESIRRLVARGLRRYGYTVLTAADGAEALEVLQKHGRDIDLLVTDVVMPRLDGQGLADELRRRAPHVRILFSSGYTDDAILRYGVLHAEVSFLQKPYTVEGLVHKIRQTLDAR